MGAAGPGGTSSVVDVPLPPPAPATDLTRAARPVAPRHRRAPTCARDRRRRRHAGADAGARAGDHGGRPGRDHGGHVRDDAHVCAGARAVRRRHRFIPGGPAPPGGGAGAGRGRGQRRAVRGVGGRRVGARGRVGRGRDGEGLLRPGGARRCARPRSRCTVGSATPGSASCTCTSAERCCRARCSATRAITCGGWHAVDWGTTVDFDDSPEEAGVPAAHPRVAGRSTTRGCPRRRPMTSTGRDRRSGTARCSTRGSSRSTWPTEYGGQGLSPVYEVIVDEELAAAGAPPKPSLGYLIQGISRHGSDEICDRFLPALISGRDRWCQGFSEPDAGSDLASLRTRAVLDGDEYVVDGHKIWTSYSDVADWCLLLARTDPERPEAQGDLGVRGADAPAGDRATTAQDDQRDHQRVRPGALRRCARPGRQHDRPPGEGWALAMTVVSHEREPTELGYVARYTKLVKELEARGPRASRPVPAGSGRDPRARVRRVGDVAPARAASALRTARRRHPRSRRLDRQAAHDHRRAGRRARRARDRRALTRCSTPTTPG